MFIDWGFPIFQIGDEDSISKLYQVCWRYKRNSAKLRVLIARIIIWEYDYMH
jgi:hypothetical protein